MSYFDMMGGVDVEKLSDNVFKHEEAQKCLMGMGQTSENVAEQFGITRQMQDELALSSQVKAVKASEEGWLQSEITPMKVTVVGKDGKKTEVIADKDEGVRKTTAEVLAKLKPSFKEGGTTTAGNSSQLTDGAAAVLLARRSFAKQHGLPILGRVVSYAVAGVPPEVMGIGPAFAIPKALDKAGLKVDDIDIFEINEAFASQALYCVKKLGIDQKKLNPKGGAIALGHPLGMTGARMIVTLMKELERTDKKYGVVSMCIGTGMGACAVIQRE